MTFNQTTYITDALNGFVMQQTIFPFVCTIVDDASTDGEQEVIRKYVQDHFDCQDSTVAYEKDTNYGHVTFAQHKNNKNCYFVVVYLNENHFSQKKSKASYIAEWANAKYVALCEGDDYWTDPLKLQKQVDFLEAHPNYSLCCHRYKIYNQNEGTWDDDYKKNLIEESPNGFSFGNKENYDKWITTTLTLMYRKNCYDSSELVKYKYRCDVHVNYHLLKKGLGYCLPFIGAVYRRSDSGVFSSLSEIEKTKRWYKIRSELLKFNLSDRDLRDHVYSRMKKYLYYHPSTYCEAAYLALVVLKSFYKTEGLGKTIVVAKKIIGSYVKGLKR